jgi:hypothetical protein
VRIILHDVEEFRAAEEYGYEIQVCNFGIFAHRLEQKVAIQFGYTIDESGSLEGIRKSEGYAFGSEIELEVSDLSAEHFVDP